MGKPNVSEIQSTAVHEGFEVMMLYYNSCLSSILSF